MRTLVTASTLALVATTAAAQTDATQALDVEAYRDGFSAEQLIGRAVVGTDGEEMGAVQSLLLSPEGQIERAVLEIGGFLDIGDKAIAVPWDQIALQGDGEPVRVEGVEADNIEQFSLFEDEGEVEAEGRRFRADELLDDFVETADGRNVGYVDDLIFSRDGELGGVVVMPDIRYPTASWLAFPFHGYGDELGFDPGEDVYRVPAMDDDDAIYEPFPYRDWIESAELAL